MGMLHPGRQYMVYRGRGLPMTNLLTNLIRLKSHLSNPTMGCIALFRQPLSLDHGKWNYRRLSLLYFTSLALLSTVSLSFLQSNFLCASLCLSVTNDGPERSSIAS